VPRKENPRRSRGPSLASLEVAAQAKASALDFDERLAALAYAICAIDPGSLQGHLWLGRALASVGDSDGTLEVFRRAGSLARDEADRRGVAAAFVRAKRLLENPDGPGGCTLTALRQRGWAGVDEIIAWARTDGRPRRKCASCDGWGYLQWFKEHDRGRCYACNGTGYMS